MKKYLFLFIAILIVSCCCGPKRQEVSVDVSTMTDTVDIFRNVFKSKVMQDSLDAFIAETEDFRGHDTVVYSVFVSVMPNYQADETKDNPDTFVVFIRDCSDKIWFNYIPEEPEKTIILGAAAKGNKIIGVSSYGLSDCSDFFNENDYSADIWRRFYFEDLLKLCEIDAFWRCSDEYEVAGNNFILQHRHRYYDFKRQKK